MLNDAFTRFWLTLLTLVFCFRLWHMWTPLRHAVPVYAYLIHAVWRQIMSTCGIFGAHLSFSPFSHHSGISDKPHMWPNAFPLRPFGSKELIQTDMQTSAVLLMFWRNANHTCQRYFCGILRVTNTWLPLEVNGGKLISPSGSLNYWVIIHYRGWKYILSWALGFLLGLEEQRLRGNERNTNGVQHLSHLTRHRFCHSRQGKKQRLVRLATSKVSSLPLVRWDEPKHWSAWLFVDGKIRLIS